MRSAAMAERTSILIVEDEPLIAMMLEDFIDSMGYRVVATCDTLGEALEQVEQGGFDLAILDVHLNGETVWPLAERLSAEKIPFILATGGHVDPPPAKFNQVMVIEKPYTMERVSVVIEAALAGA
ncbi:MAG: response regulator [Sphingomicrobium sp.]